MEFETCFICGEVQEDCYCDDICEECGADFGLGEECLCFCCESCDALEEDDDEG